VAGLLALAAIWGLYSSDGATKARARDTRLEQARSEGPAEVGPSLEVRALTVAREPSVEVVELAAPLEPVRRTWVAAEIAGRIEEVGTAEHATIENGGLLVRLDAALPRAELIRAEASHQLARLERDRQQTLGNRSVASKAELDRAQAEERQAYAALVEARTRLEHTRIRAPFDGLVNQLDFDPGAYVQPGTTIAEILDVSTIEIEVPVSDRQVSAIAVGDPAQVRIDPLGNDIIEGRVVRVGRAPQTESQRYPVVVALDNPEGRLLPGMLAHVRLETGQRESIRIPAGAVLHEFELDYVYVLDERDTVKRARVTTRPVPFRPDQAEVREGLSDGDRVVTTAVSQLRDGLRVRVRAR
jgi:membrane fusion protein (multidrug efflux system)